MEMALALTVMVTVTGLVTVAICCKLECVFPCFCLSLSCSPAIDLPLFLVVHKGGTLARRARAGRAPGIFCDPCPTGGLLPLICWATLYGFAPWPPGHQQMF